MNFDEAALPPGPITRDIANAVTLGTSPGSRYKILQLSAYRDRLNSGLDPMFDYYCIRGFFFKVPKTVQQIIEHEEHRVPEFEPAIVDGRKRLQD
jgi:hypothetical protein